MELISILMLFSTCSKKHLVAVLYFRGLIRGHEHQLILRRLTALKREGNIASSDRNQVLFSNMQVTVNTNCLSNFPYSCFSFLMPDNQENTAGITPQSVMKCVTCGLVLVTCPKPYILCTTDICYVTCLFVCLFLFGGGGCLFVCFLFIYVIRYK